MSAAHRIRELEQRSEALERRVALLERVDSPAPPADRRAALRVADRPGAHLTGAPRRPAAARATPDRTATPAMSLEDLLGGRVLGWIGAVAVLVGLIFLLVLAASRGWIGHEARVLMAA